MKLFVRYVLLALGGLAWSCQSPIMAQNMAESDSIAVIASTDSLLAQPAPQKLNLFQKVLKYFNESNEPRPDKKFDFGIIGGPHYSSTTKLGLGIVASGPIACDTTRSHNSPTYRSTATPPPRLPAHRGQGQQHIPRKQIPHRLRLLPLYLPQRLLGNRLRQRQQQRQQEQLQPARNHRAHRLAGPPL